MPQFSPASQHHPVHTLTSSRSVTLFPAQILACKVDIDLWLAYAVYFAREIIATLGSQSHTRGADPEARKSLSSTRRDVSREFQVPVVLMVAPHRCEVYRIQGPKAVHCHVWAKLFVHIHYAGRLLPGGGSSVHTVENDSQGQGIWKCVVRGLDHVSVSSRSCLVVLRENPGSLVPTSSKAPVTRVLSKCLKKLGNASELMQQ